MVTLSIEDVFECLTNRSVPGQCSTLGIKRLLERLI